MRKLFSCVFVGILAAAAACSTSTTDPGDGDELVPEDEAPPADDVTDESAGEDALAVLQGEQPGVVIIVEFAEGSDVDQVTEALAEQYGLVITSRYHDLGGAAFIAPDQSIAEQVRLDVRVIGVTNDRLVAASPGDELASEVDGFMAEAAASGEGDVDAASQTRSTGWRLIGVDRAPGNGSGVRVAVIDTGMDLKHPDLKGAYASGYGKDCVRRKNKTLMDRNGHGSHVSGIIAAQNNARGVVGVAPGARVVPVRVLNAEGSGSFSAVLCGIDYVSRRADRIQVANLSLGADCGGPCEFGAPHHKGLRKLWNRGVTVVVAAGNEGIDADESDPAFIDELITVSAYMDGNGVISSKDRYASFSNWGPGVDIGAPGVKILSTVPGGGYERLSGTSMAAPFVAGVAAVIEGTRGGTPNGVWLGLAGASLGSYPGRGGRHPEGLLRMPGAGTQSACGNAICDDGEDDDSCAADCGCAASACAGDAPAGCSCETDCTGEACCSDSDICPIM